MKLVVGVATGDDEIDAGVKKFGKRIAELKELHSKQPAHGSPEVDLVASNIRATIRDVFGEGSQEYRDHQYHELWSGRKIIGAASDYYNRCVADGIGASILLMENLIGRLEERKEELPEPVAGSSQLSQVGLGPDQA